MYECWNLNESFELLLFSMCLNGRDFMNHDMCRFARFHII